MRVDCGATYAHTRGMATIVVQHQGTQDTVFGGHYRLLRPLNASTDTVLARDERLDRTVVLWMGAVEAGHENENRSLYQQFGLLGILASARFTHPNVVHVFDAGVDGMHRYLVTEYVDGESLSERVARQPLLWHEAVELLLPLAEALHAVADVVNLPLAVAPHGLRFAGRDRLKIVSLRVVDHVPPGHTGAAGVAPLAASITAAWLGTILRDMVARENKAATEFSLCIPPTIEPTIEPPPVPLRVVLDRAISGGFASPAAFAQALRTVVHQHQRSTTIWDVPRGSPSRFRRLAPLAALLGVLCIGAILVLTARTGASLAAPIPNTATDVPVGAPGTTSILPTAVVEIAHTTVAAATITPSATPTPIFVSVPSVMGVQIADATERLRRVDLVVDQQLAAESNTSGGMVIGQIPQAGSDVAPGMTVHLTVSPGQLPTVAPFVNGQEEVSVCGQQKYPPLARKRIIP